MRWLKNRLEQERGAVAALIGLLLIPLIGMAALTIDIGAVYLERRELQNGADAAALAAAEECARFEQLTGSTLCPLDIATAQADIYAPANAGDGFAAIEQVDVSVPRTVTVRTSTATADGGSILPYRLARVLGRDGVQVRAEATAVYGPITSAAAFPLVLCAETFAPAIDLLIVAPGGGDSEEDEPCPGPGRSGLQLPGGWGWLQNLDGSDCEATIDLPIAYSQVGIVAPGRCRPLLEELRMDIDAGDTPELLIPMYSDSQGMGSGGQFTLSGFAKFRVAGFYFHAVQGGPPVGAPSADPPCGPGKPGVRLSEAHACIAGHFLGSLSLEGAVDPEAPVDFGVLGVKLTH